MKTYILLILILLSPGAFSQVTDSFEDGDFTNNPHWSGDSAQFEVNAAKQLHLKGGLPDTSCLATPLTWFREMEWNFWIKLSFNTSANNYARVYLRSEEADLSGPVHGYYVQAGGSNDSLSLCRQDGESSTRLIAFPLGALCHSVNTLRFRISRSEGGTWEAFTDTTGGMAFLPEGTIADTTYQGDGWVGLFCKYTASNATKIYLDEVYAGRLIRDTVPPSLKQVEVADSSSLLVVFKEIPSLPGVLLPEHYFLEGKGIHPGIVMPEENDPASFRLIFGSLFPEGYCDTLLVAGIADPAGNLSPDTAAGFCRYHPGAFDVLIHEVMADPDPPAGLPPVEYVELFNRCSFPVSLKGWSFEYGYASKPFPPVTLPPGGYLILTGDVPPGPCGPSLSLFTSETSLANGGSVLVLRDGLHRVIHTVTYTSRWYSGSFKEEGGWSLEMADPFNPCGCEENWQACRDPSGGTPGRANSVRAKVADTEPVSLVRTVVLSRNEVRVLLSEPADSVSLSDRARWRITPGAPPPDSLSLHGPSYDEVSLFYSPGFDSGVVYRIGCAPGLRDCAGNLQEEDREIPAAIPVPVRANEIRINEILWDPDPAGSRYLEVYNPGDSPYDLSGLAISYRSLTESVPAGPRPVAGEPFILFPQSYAAICEDAHEVMTRYRVPDRTAFLEMESFPAFSKSGGTVALLALSDFRRIDSIRYESGMHYPLLTRTSGVSLERIHAEGSSVDRANWHSASSASGYGTPGYRNSQSFGEAGGDDRLTADPPVFSPDNDGFDDILRIALRADAPGSLAGIMIFDAQGRKIRNLADGRLMGEEDVFFWDGMDDHRQPALPGHYIVCAEICNEDGSVTRSRKVVAIAVPR